MYEDNDDLFSFFNSYNSGSTTTETEQETDTTVGYNPSSYNGYSSNQDTGFVDDYTTNQNFEEQRFYQPTQTSNPVQTTTVAPSRNMETPMILKEEKAVTLTKTRQKIQLNSRMKIMIAMFSVIMAALVFVIAFNFVTASKINANSAQKIQTIESLQASISELSDSYNVYTSDEYLKQQGFVESNETNTFRVSLEEIPAEPTVAELPSNWFNDVCEFFSKLFA